MSIDEYIKLPDVLDGVDIDHAYGEQCWDLVEDYAERVLQVPRNPWAITLNPDINAKSAWLHYDQNPQLQKYFDQIPAGQEQKGDIVVYNGHGSFSEGHIAICLGNGQVFEQNADPDGSKPHIYTRSNTYRLGSLRLKGGSMIPTDILRMVAGEIEGFDPSVYDGAHDQQLIDAWANKPLEEYVRSAWNGQAKKRYMLQAENDDLKAQLAAKPNDFVKVGDLYVKK